MDKIIKDGIVSIIKSNRDLLKIPLKQKAKFEGWLKFELAYYLCQIKMENVEVEYQSYYTRNRTDIVFFHNDNFYSVELKTCNTNWGIDGINPNTRPITKNIQSVIDDAIKLNSTQGIVAFTIFPIPINDNRWKKYIERIAEKTGIEIKSENCEIIQLDVNEKKSCNLVVCTFKSKKIRNW
ncbi:hypothetical protein Barb7_00259 [Bacteroidales bacterium Barb7]|nr:hypothetical protein Barb7_00259 [Bacteroidales bacterium Barb7]